ncbi:DUF4065 domain-containing protein [Ectothiorhodospiraceae bacterium BW-2]|nr:DUF4065 domain-containing protein [Ectothiorhodospiraceae bacterium BW-2]
MFNESKVTHMAAYLLKKAEEFTLPHLKLMKLLYLAERRSYLEHGYGISDDTLVSMPYGPVLSSTLNLMNGELGRERVWQAYISDKADHKVSLVNADIMIEDLDELSQSDRKILDEVWAQFKDFSQFELSNYTHDPKNCPEWEDPNGSSFPIDLKRLFASEGRTPEQVAILAYQVQTQRNLETMFNRH